MATTTRNLRRYDHRLRELVRTTGDIQHAIHRGVPRSTARGWLKSPRTEVVTVDITEMDVLRLQQELLTLRRRVARFVALLRILVILLKLSGFLLAATMAGIHTADAGCGWPSVKRRGARRRPFPSTAQRWLRRKPTARGPGRYPAGRG